jgi:hypothetical protein
MAGMFNPLGTIAQTLQGQGPLRQQSPGFGPEVNNFSGVNPVEGYGSGPMGGFQPQATVGANPLQSYQGGMNQVYPTLGNDAIGGASPLQQRQGMQLMARNFGYTGGFGGGQFRNFLNSGNQPAWANYRNQQQNGMAPGAAVQPQKSGAFNALTGNYK